MQSAKIWLSESKNFKMLGNLTINPDLTYYSHFTSWLAAQHKVRPGRIKQQKQIDDEMTT